MPAGMTLGLAVCDMTPANKAPTCLNPRPNCCNLAVGPPEVKGATGKRGPPANVAFGGTLTATRPRVSGSTLGNSQPGSPARARPRQVNSLGLQLGIGNCNVSVGF